MFTSQSYGYQAQPYGAYGNSVTPQGLDLGSIVNTVTQGAAHILPGLIANLLSAHPQIQQLTQQGASTGGFNQQTQYGGLNAFANRPQFATFGAHPFGAQQYGAQQFGAQPYGAVSPQGFDFGNIVGTIAQGAAQVLPGLLMSLLSANPQIQQLTRQGAHAGGLNPLSMHGGGLNMFENRPQFAWQQGAGVAPQSFDIGGIVTTIAQGAAQVLPGLIASLLSAHPQIQQLARHGQGFGQGLGQVQGQGFGQGLGQGQGQGFGQGLGQGQGLAGAYGLNQWGTAGLAPQGFDVSAIAQNIASIISPQIPGIVGGVMGQAFGNQPTTVH